MIPTRDHALKSLAEVTRRFQQAGQAAASAFLGLHKALDTPYWREWVHTMAQQEREQRIRRAGRQPGWVGQALRRKR